MKQLVILSVSVILLLAIGTFARAQFERKIVIPTSEQVEQSNLIISRIDAAYGSVSRQLQQARQARDVVKTLCLNDKLTQIDVARRTAQDRKSNLQNAVITKDNELSNHEYTLIVILRGRVEQLVTEANQCLGEDMAFIGQTTVEVTVTPGLPDDTTGFPPETPGVITMPPVAVSPIGQ